ncbi:MAG: DUF975 family protein [Eubacterium sp.]|nr:DUF975 family protein [Eubacterium sp.]
MEKDLIFSQRKELKKRSRQVVRSHYFLLVFLMIVMAFFGNEFRMAKEGLSRKTFLEIRQGGDEETTEGTAGEPAGTEDPGSVLDDGAVLDSDRVLSELMSGNLQRGDEIAGELDEQIAENGDDSRTLGRTRGVLAEVVNAASSGRIMVRIAQGIRGIVSSDKAVGVVISVVSLLVFVLSFVFLKNVYSAVVRRLFLEARVYEKVSFLEGLHFLAVKRWIRASMTMLLKYVLQMLWSLTIIGGIIKYFSYFAVPYIVAENPDIRPREAVTLSRRMMDGHKWELFKYYLSLLGWILLGYITLGISDLVYGAAYRTACTTEFYVKVREQAIAQGIEGTERLFDQYLYEKCDKIKLLETYFDVVDEITLIYEERTVLTGAKKFLSDWFSIWIDSVESKKQYDNQEGRILAIEAYKLSMDGLAYPQRLNPQRKIKGIRKQGNFSFLRSYTVYTLFLVFIIFSVIGWFWEVGLHYMSFGVLVNRGTMLGPWIPIYGFGGVFVLMLCSRFRKHPVREFFAAMIVSGVLEYIGGWMLETKFHERWWSYDGYFLNIHGRVCAEGLLAFGVLCTLVVYLVAPILDFLIMKIRHRVLVILCIVLAILFGIDLGHSMVHPNRAEGAVVNEESEDGY